MTEAFDVSVIIPLYNKAPFIRGTLQSVMAQTHRPAEIIIVDDGSTDGSVDVIADLIGGMVDLVRQANAGPGPARNRGIAEASSEWVAFIDGDDHWTPDHLRTLARLHDRFPDAATLATSFKRLPFEQRSEASGAIGADVATLVNYFDQEVGSGGLSSSSVAVRRSACQAVGGFGDKFPGEDSVLWIRLALDTLIAQSSRVTAYYMQGTGGIMERLNEQRIGFQLNPIFPVLDAALADARYAGKHPSIRQFRARWLGQTVRQALYRGEPGVARAFIRMLHTEQRARLGLRMLARLPAWALRRGMALRARLRVSQSSKQTPRDASCH